MTDIAELELRVKTADLARAEQAQRQFADTAEQTEGRVSSAFGRIASVFGLTSRQLAATAGTVAGSIAAAFGARAVINEAQQFETTMLRVQAVINATSGAAGRSAEQLREQARELARSTLESTEGTLRAQQTLLTFRQVQGEIFDRAIRAAADMSSALGGDLNSAAMQLGRALENPVQGMSALTRSGTVFTQAQRDTVQAMVAAGRTADAQRFILAELEAQYGGAAVAAAQGLAGAQDTLGQAMQELRLEIAEQLGLLDLASRANLAMADAVNTVTANIPGIINGFKGFGVVLAGLAATQIPGIVMGLAAMTSGMTLGSVAAATFAAAMRGVGVAVALAGGPLGILVGVLAGAAAYMLLFRDNTETAAPIMDEAKEAVDRINGVLAQSSEHYLPAAARATLNLTNENIRLAQSAYAAAEAEVAKAQAMMQYAQTDLGLQQAFSPTGEHTQAISDQEAAIARLTSAQTSLREAQTSLASRIGEGQLALSQASEEMERSQRRAIELSLSLDMVNTAAAGGGAMTDGFAARMEALQRGLMTEREVVEAWYQESLEILNDRRAQEILSEEEHREALLRVEQLYQEQLAAIRSASSERTLTESADFFGAMAGLAQQGGDRLVRATRVFGAIEALINTYRAQAQVLADPSLGFFGKMAAYVKIGAAGLGLVNAIRGGAGGGGGGGGGSLQSRLIRQPPAEPGRPSPRVIRIEVEGEGVYADMIRRSTEQIVDALYTETQRGGSVFVVGRG